MDKPEIDITVQTIERAVESAVEGAVERIIDQAAERAAAKLVEWVMMSTSNLPPEQRIASIVELLKAGKPGALSAAAPPKSKTSDHVHEVSLAEEKTELAKSFGLATKLGISYGDGVEYQKRVRSEWDD